VTRKTSFFLAIMAVTACVSSPETLSPRPVSAAPTRTLQDLNGSQIVMPVGLFLAGLDIDRDTRISRTEIRDGAAESFARSDTDESAHLSPIEFSNWSQTNFGTEESVPGRLHFDLDQDGLISLSEFDATFDLIFQRLDTNRDGALERVELLVQVDGTGIDQQAVRAQIEAEIRQEMQNKVRDMCRRGGRSG
jgi:hypothetical protein